MFKSIVAPILALLGALAVLAGSHYFVYKHGEREGVDSYHNVCYHNGPLLIQDDPTRTVVMCAPAKEDKKGLDRF